MAAQTAIFSTNIDTVFYHFVAIGAGTRNLNSLDGETWTSTTLTAYPLLTDMAYGKNILVALGQTVNTIGMVYTTPAAEALATWTIRGLAPATGLANIGWQAIAFGGGTWVAVGGGITATVRTTATCTMTSTNSANWTLYNGLTAADWRCIAFGGGKFVTLSYGSNLARYSSDLGQTWSNGNSLPIGNWKSVVYDRTNAKFVAVAMQGIKVIAGTATCTSLQFTTGTNTITRVAGDFVADGYLTGQSIVVTGTGSNNGTYTITGTVNTLTMTVVEALVNEGPLTSLATINSKAGDGTAFSSDGITWSQGSPTSAMEAGKWISIATNDAGRCIAISNHVAGQVVSYTTDGGTNWVSVTLPLIATWTSITYGESGVNFHRWLAVNSTVANCAYSDDGGLTWSLGPMTTYAWTKVIWAPFPIHSNDTLTIDRGSTITVNTDQHPALTSLPITNGKLLIKNTSTTEAMRFVTIRTSGVAAQAITPTSGLGTIDIQGNWIQIGTGDNSANQAMSVPYTDYVSAVWVETATADQYEIWLNVSGAYGGTLKQYQDGLLDVSTGQRGKFFIQTPNTVQDKYITLTATVTFGLFSVLVDTIEGIYQGASITGQGIPANAVIEIVPKITASVGRTLTFSTTAETITATSGSFIRDGFEAGDSLIVTGTVSNNGTLTITDVTATTITVSQNLTDEGPLSSTAVIKVNKVIMNVLPVTPGASYTATGYTNIPVKIFNPYSSQFTNEIVFGDGTNGNKIPNGRKVRVPNIMITSDTPANVHTSSAVIGCYFNLGNGGNMLIDTCLFDEVYQNWLQAQQLTITNLGMHNRPVTTALSETYALSINGWGLAMPPVRRYNTSNVWAGRDIRDTLINSLIISYISNADINDVAMVLQAPNAITAGTLAAPTGMFNLSYSDAVTVANMRMYALNPTRAYQYGLALIATVTNSTFTNIEYYGGPMLNVQLSSSNTFTNLINSETMFSHSHNYTAGMRVTHDPSLEADMVAGTKYYFKSRSFFTRDRTEYTESRTYSATPFKGSTYFPDYVTCYLSAPQQVTFGWTHRTPMYTADTSPLVNADSKNFLEIYRGTSPGFTKNLAAKVAGFNNAPSISIPTIVVWATDTRTLTLDATGSVYTITASSGSFITDGFATGQKLTVRGATTHANNKTYTITGTVTATVITVTESLTTESTYTQELSIVSKYVPTPKLFLTAAGGRTLTFTNLTLTASARNITFGGTVALPTTAPKMAAGARTLSFVRSNSTITCSSGSFVTDGFLVGDKIYVTGTASNNTLPGNFYTLTVVAAGTLTLTPASDYLTDETNVATPATIWAMRTTITCSSGSFTTDGYVVGDRIKVTGTTYNNTSGTNYLTVTVVAATMLTCGGDLVFPEGPFSATATLTVYRLYGSTGSFVTDGYAPGDILEVTGSANAGNNKTFTVLSLIAGYLYLIEPTTTQAAESSGATLTAKIMPIPKVVFLNASPNREIAFQNSSAQAATTTRIMTFDYINRTVRSTGTIPGNFIREGFMIGDKVEVTNTTYNNKVVFTITAVTATLLTMGATDRLYDETSTTATLTANRIKASTGSFITDGWVIGDTVTVTGTSSNNGSYTVNNVVALALSLTSTVVNETLSYRTGAVITATKLISRQKIYGTAARTFTTAAAAKTLTLSSGSMVQDGYIVGDKVLVSGMGTDGNHVYTIGTLTTVILTWLEAAAPTTSLVGTNAVTWVHGGNRPGILGNASTQTWDAPNKYLTLGTGTWDTTYGFVVGDRILVTGQKYNNGLFTIANISTNRITVTEPVIHDPTTYSASSNIIYGYMNPQKRTVTAAAGRTLTFDNISKKVTASTGDFRVSAGTGTGDGYAVGDCVQIAGTAGGLNDGYFTISAVSQLVMYFNELIYPQAAVSSSVTISAPDIAHDTDYYYVVRKYDDTGSYNDSEEIYVKSTWQEQTTNLCLQSKDFVGVKINPLHATAARTLQFVAATKKITSTGATSFITETYAVGDKLKVTRTTSNNGYYTIVAVAANDLTVLETLVDEGPLSTSGTITNIYWDNLNVPRFVASAVRTLQFTTASSQAAVTTRIFGFSGTTISVTGTTPGSFVTDGLITGDKIIICGTSANNGIFTITGTVNATSITTVESLVTESGNTTGLIRCRKITLAGTTPGSFVTDGYAVNDRITVSGTTSNDATFTIATVETTKMTVYEATVAEGPLSSAAIITCEYITVSGSAVRISPFVSQAATQTAEALSLTSLIDNATITQPISTAIDNPYTFSVWVCTNPTIVKVATLTASATRSYKFDGLSLTATASRTLQWSSSGNTITAGGASPGSFHTDGYAVGDKLIVTGTSSNNGTFTITTLTATVITVAETLVSEGPLSATATIKVNKITAYGTTPRQFIEAGFEIGDRVQAAGGGSTYNLGWFTVTNVTAHILNVAETVYTEATLTATLTLTGYYNDTLTIDGEIRLGTAVQAFTATALWQKVTVTFTATATLHNAVFQIDTQKRVLCVYGAMVNTGSSALPYRSTTTAPASNINKVRDIVLVRTWCRGYGEAATHSGVEIQLAAAVTGEIFTEVNCGTTSNFGANFINKVFDTWPGSGQTLVFNNTSSNNIVDGFTQTGIGAPVNYGLAYFAIGSSRNRIKDLTYNLHGAIQLYLATFLSQSNDQSFYNWNIKNWRNYASTVGNVPILATSNATSGLTAENISFNNSDFPIMDNALNFLIKGMSGGNVKPLNSALLYNMPVTPVYTLATTPAATVNFDTVTNTGVPATPANYTTVYDTIFKELYHTTTTGSLFIQFNASSKDIKPYTLSGNASFSNNGRLYLITAGDSIEYTWPHKILGVTGFQNVPFLLNGNDLGNTPSMLEGLKIEYKIDTGSGYGANWAEATPATLSALTVSATDGFYLKLKLTASAGMKYSGVVKPFIEGESIRGLSSLATAVVNKDFYYPVSGSCRLTSVSGTFVPGEIIVSNDPSRDGEMRCVNVATNTTFALFPSVASYIDGLQIYTTVNQLAKYPANVATITLNNIVPGSLFYIYNSDTNALVARGTATGTPAPEESTIDYSVSVSFDEAFDITVNVRKSSAPVKYLPFESGGTVTTAGASVFIAQVIDSVVLDSYAAIAADWTIDVDYETIRHTSGSTVYTVNHFYSYLQDYFDELGYLDDQIPMNASTPTEYNLINGWFIDDESFKYLSDGAITTLGQNAQVYALTFDSVGYTSAVAGDLTKLVTNGGGTHTGRLLAYDNTRRVWWIRKVLSTFTAEAVTITSGTGAGTITSVATGESIWGNIFTLGTIVSGTTLDVYQNDGQITPWWGTNHIDILVKVKESGVEIDSGNLTVLARYYQTLYDHFVIDASSGRNPVPLAAFSDGNNQTAEGTVGAYAGITFDFGYVTKNMGAGAKPYDVVIECNDHTLQEIYEYLKYVTRSGSVTALNGVAGEYYTGCGDVRFDYNNEAVGSFVEGELVTGTGGARGYLVSLLDSGSTGSMLLRNVHGSFTTSMSILGSTNGATANISGAVTTITPQKQAPFGTYAGGTFFGARGVWLENVASADANDYQLIDALGVTQVPPPSVLIAVYGVVEGDKVAVFRTVGNTEVLDKAMYYSDASSNALTDTTFVVGTAIESDTPSSGKIRVVDRDSSGKILSETSYSYTSWTGSTFTLSEPLTATYNEYDSVYVPYIDTTCPALADSVSVSVTFNVNRYVVTRVRHKGIVPFAVTGELKNTGLPVTAIRTEDTIVT